MEIGHWIVLGIWFVGQLTAVFIAWNKVQLKLKEMEMLIKAQNQNIKDNQTSFHVHEAQNEKMFDKFEKKQEDTFQLVNEIKNILISQK